MKFNLLSNIILLLVVFAGTQFQAEAQGNYDELDVSEYFKSGPEDASAIMGAYFNPLFTGLGFATADGWYNTAKAHKPLGFDISLNMNVASVPSSEYNYNFNQADYNAIQLTDGRTSASLPTIFGDPEVLDPNGNPVSFTVAGIADRTLPAGAPTTASIVPTFNAPGGLDYGSNDNLRGYVPIPLMQVGIGLIKNTDLKLRWMPALTDVEDEGVEISMIGVGVMHDVKQWIPGIKHVPIDLAVLVAYNNIKAKADLSGGLEGDNQVGEMNINSLTYQAIISKKLSILTLYAGLGYSQVKTTLEVKGTYLLEYDIEDANGNSIEDPANPGTRLRLSAGQLTDPVDEEFGTGGKSARATIGARLKLAIITLNAEYTLQKYNTFSAGIGFSIR